MDDLLDLFSRLNGVMFEGLVQPVLFANGWVNLAEDAYTACEWFLLGLLFQYFSVFLLLQDKLM